MGQVVYMFTYSQGATPLDPDELEGLKFPHVDTKSELDQLEQQNIQEGLIWLEKQRKYKDFINESFARELHKQLFGSVWDWAGKFRLSDKNIGVDYLVIGVKLKDLFDDANYWVENRIYNKEEFAAKFHHKLVLIHPFPNGNGRHARIMTDIILEKYLKESPIKWGGDSLISDSDHRKHYIDALRMADKGDYQSLIEFISR